MVINLYQQFGTSKDLETNGVIFTLMDGVSFTLARAGGENIKYQKTMTSMLKPYKRQLSLGTLDDKIARGILIKAFCKGVLLSWDGVTDKVNKPITFNEENAVKLFLDLPDLFDTLNEESQNMTNFREGEIEQVVKK